MSANNEMLVFFYEGFWYVDMNLCVDNELSLSDLVKFRGNGKKFISLSEAFSYANKVCDEEVVEYGVRYLGDLTGDG